MEQIHALKVTTLAIREWEGFLRSLGATHITEVDNWREFEEFSISGNLKGEWISIKAEDGHTAVWKNGRLIEGMTAERLNALCEEFYEERHCRGEMSLRDKQDLEEFFAQVINPEDLDDIERGTDIRFLADSILRWYPLNHGCRSALSIWIAIQLGAERLQEMD